jgi:hypothetical protein
LERKEKESVAARLAVRPSLSPHKINLPFLERKERESLADRLGVSMQEGKPA